MELKEIKKLGGYCVEYEGQIFDSIFEVENLIKRDYKITYLDKPTNLKDLGLKDVFKMGIKDITAFIPVVLKIDKYYNMLVISQSPLGLKFFKVGLIQEPILVKDENGKIIGCKVLSTKTRLVKYK